MSSSDGVSQRASREDHMYRYCRVMGCPHPARAGTSNGLDRRFCRKHADHYSRHGSPYRPSYRADELAPARKRVRTWLKENRDHVFVTNAAQRIEGLYSRSGTHTEAFRLSGMSAAERAEKAWARLRESSVTPMKILEAWLVVSALCDGDDTAQTDTEFKRVQAAKQVHRLASGSHRRWEREVPIHRGATATTSHVTEIHKYPHSRGRILRIIGKDMEEACELAAQEFFRWHNSTSLE